METTDKQKSRNSVAKWLQICEQQPELARLFKKASRVATAYYPIVRLEMKLLEYSFEDFNAVELSILRFFSCGITTAEGISKWMGLDSSRYIDERLALLQAEGLIDKAKGTVTKLGLDSLKVGMKKKLHDTAQVFQADGVTGILIPKESQIRDMHLVERERTARLFPIIAHTEEIAVRNISDAIKGEDKIQNYKRYRKSILHVNVEDIIDIKLRDIKYAKAFLVWCDDFGNVPLVFLPYFKPGEVMDMHHCDMPLFIPEKMEERLP